MIYFIYNGGPGLGIALSNRWKQNFLVTLLLSGYYLAIVSRRREITVSLADLRHADLKIKHRARNFGISSRLKNPF